MASSPNSLEKETCQKAAAQVAKQGATWHDMYRDFDGVYCNKFFSDESLRSALSYKPRDDDVFLVSYPKCGTTWMQHITCNIFRLGSPPESLMELMFISPFLEFLGAESVHAMKRPGAIKTHLPFNKQPYSAKAKYIYITRNPYDCCVSYYYHTKTLPLHNFEDGTFDQFFEMFMEGKVDFGDYFDHLLSWYEHRNDDNVFFLTYEQLKEDTPGMVLKIADFLGKEQYGDKFRQHPEIFEKVLNAISIESMKKINAELKNMAQTMSSMPPESMPAFLKSAMAAFGEIAKKPMQGDFVRKGIVGDWKNHFSAEQISRLKGKIAAKTAGSDVMNLWKDTDIP